jgi:hypothetical protein
MRNITGKQEQLLSKNLKGTWEEHVSETTISKTPLHRCNSRVILTSIVNTTDTDDLWLSGLYYSPPW